MQTIKDYSNSTRARKMENLRTGFPFIVAKICGYTWIILSFSSCIHFSPEIKTNFGVYTDEIKS